MFHCKVRHPSIHDQGRLLKVSRTISWQTYSYNSNSALNTGKPGFWPLSRLASLPHPTMELKFDRLMQEIRSNTFLSIFNLSTPPFTPIITYIFCLQRSFCSSSSVMCSDTKSNNFNHNISLCSHHQDRSSLAPSLTVLRGRNLDSWLSLFLSSDILLCLSYFQPAIYHPSVVEASPPSSYATLCYTSQT